MTAVETVLVVDDYRPNRLMLAKLVKSMGYDVIEADDGNTALAILNEISHQSKIKLVAILSDVMMPQMDGISFLRHVRKIEQFAEIPFVFITAIADARCMSQARDLNAAGYLLKPVSVSRVMHKLLEIFPGRICDLEDAA